MKTRKEHLIEYAFGELSDAEKKGLNPTAAERRKLDEFACLRADLKRLKEVPECQMSVERMRDAILKAEIRQRKDWKRWLPLSSVPLAAGLVLVALALVKGPDVPESQSSMASTKPTTMVADLGAGPTHDFVADTATVGSIMDNTTSFVNDLAPNVEKVETPATAHGRWNRVSAVRLASRVKTAPTKAVAPKVATVKASVPAPTGQPEPIVMISSEQDTNTGARRANEVETSHDVVIGG